MRVRKKRPFIPRTIVARMLERYIFNFRLRPEALKPYLAAPWLEPQAINGWSVVSFCILNLDRLTLWPVPPLVNFATLSCAYRIGVIDTSGKTPEPSVYITDRYADLPFIIRTAPLLLSDSIPALRPGRSREGEWSSFELRHVDGQRLFSARARPVSALHSKVFPDLDGFSEFIKNGVSSYTPSVLPDAFARVDLHKEDAAYQPLEADVEFSWLDGVWKDAPLEFDSAVFATGAKYEWSYKGLCEAVDRPVTFEDSPAPVRESDQLIYR